MELEKSIVLWCGNAANQKALAHKIHKNFVLSGIVIDEKIKVRKKKNLNIIITKIINKIRFRTLQNAWDGLQSYYNKLYPHWPDVPILRTATINAIEAHSFTTELNPELIVVSGTNLVKEPMLSIPAKIGIINLHTGLSPYVKGGPNCTNWCIANNDWHLVGSTIMWINAGIDTGNIITTETIDIRECTSLLHAHIQVMNHAHDLYIRAINYLLLAVPPYKSVAQEEIAKGQLYLTKMWTEKQQARLLKNWRKRSGINLKEKPITIDLHL